MDIKNYLQKYLKYKKKYLQLKNNITSKNLSNNLYGSNGDLVRYGRDVIPST
jgi:hypothetical protein